MCACRDLISPLQGEEFIQVVIPGRRASRFALGYFISRFQREDANHSRLSFLASVWFAVDLMSAAGNVPDKA